MPCRQHPSGQTSFPFLNPSAIELVRKAELTKDAMGPKNARVSNQSLAGQVKRILLTSVKEFHALGELSLFVWFSPLRRL